MSTWDENSIEAQLAYWKDTALLERDENYRLKDRIRKLEADHGWRHVNRVVPLDGQRVIAFFPRHGETPDTVMEATFRGNPMEYKWLTEHGSWFYASHWMPFPVAPVSP